MIIGKAVASKNKVKRKNTLKIAVKLQNTDKVQVYQRLNMVSKG